MAAMMRKKLQNRYAEWMIDSNSQKGLVKFMNMAVDDHVAEQHASPESIHMTKPMLFVVIQLLDAIYEHSQAAPIKAAMACRYSHCCNSGKLCRMASRCTVRAAIHLSEALGGFFQCTGATCDRA